MKFTSATKYLTVGCLRAVGNLVLWSVWLVLSAVLVLLIRIAVFHHIDVPGPLLRRLERELGASGFGMHCRQAQFDTHGHIVVIEPELADSPLGAHVTAERIDTSIDLWQLAVGIVRVSSIRVSGGRVILPAIKSPTGSDLAVLDGIEAYAVVTQDSVDVVDLKCHAGNLAVEGKGYWSFRSGTKAVSPAGDALPLQKVLAMLASQRPLVDRFGSPVLKLELRGGFVLVDLSTTGFRWPLPLPAAGALGAEVIAGQTELTTRLPLFGPRSEATTLKLSIESLRTEEGLLLKHVENQVVLTLPANAPPTVANIRVTADFASFKGETIEFPTLTLSGRPTDLTVDAVGRVWGEAFTLKAAGDALDRSGLVSLTSQISDAVIKGVTHVSGKPLSTILQPSEAAPFEATVSLASGGKLKRLEGWFSSGPVVARNVPLRGASADLTIENNDLLFDRIVLKTPASFARGSYWMDIHTFDYRFLLEGYLQPADISGWFKEWWPHFWSSFTFSNPAVADVEISGRWGLPESTLVYVGAFAQKPLLRDTPFDTLTTTLFIRPYFFDGLAFDAQANGKKATGTFTRKLNAESNTLSSMSFDIRSNLELELYGKLFGKEGEETLAPFHFENSPELAVKGEVRGPGNPNGPGKNIDLEINAAGGFLFHRFPLTDLYCRAHLDGASIQLPTIRTHFAGGSMEASASINGPEHDRSLTFDGHLKDATLGDAISVVQTYSQDGNAVKTPFGQSKSQKQLAAGLLTLNLSATGKYNDPFAFIGTGNATIKGGQLAQINLLGQLSQVLHSVPLFNFTSLSLDSVESQFALRKNKIDFSRLRLSGPSARIASVGTYDIKAKDMQFDVAVFPFGQNPNIFASAMNIVLSPLSVAFELHLSGALDDPKWHFALGPTGIIRRISSEDEKDPLRPERSTQPPPLLRRH